MNGELPCRIPGPVRPDAVPVQYGLRVPAETAFGSFGQFPYIIVRIESAERMTSSGPPKCRYLVKLKAAVAANIPGMIHYTGVGARLKVDIGESGIRDPAPAISPDGLFPRIPAPGVIQKATIRHFLEAEMPPYQQKNANTAISQNNCSIIREKTRLSENRFFKSGSDWKTEHFTGR